MAFLLLGLALIPCLLFGFSDSLVVATAYIGVATAFKKILELEDVGLDHPVLFSVFGVVSLWLSEEILFAKLPHWVGPSICGDTFFLHSPIFELDN